jgi:hypothetical protein
MMQRLTRLKLYFWDSAWHMSCTRGRGILMANSKTIFDKYSRGKTALTLTLGTLRYLCRELYLQKYTHIPDRNIIST